MNKYLIIIEKSKTGYSAYSPDVDGCVAVGRTIEECKASMEEALKYHIELMIEMGYEVPEPTSRNADFVKVDYKKPKKKELSLI